MPLKCNEQLFYSDLMTAATKQLVFSIKNSAGDTTKSPGVLLLSFIQRVDPFTLWLWDSLSSIVRDTLSQF